MDMFNVTVQHGLSVADASGIIAACIIVVQCFVPLAIPLILLALLREKNSIATTSAVTWSVVGSMLHSSFWPDILGADSASVTAVPTRISLLARFEWLLAVLIAVAGIVTPLGLYDKVVASSSPTPSAFHYVHDPSAFGYVMPPEENPPWSRICGGAVPASCPNSFSNVTTMTNSTGAYSWVEKYDTTVPQYVIDVFQSGLTAFNKSVSSLFDIQARYYTWARKSKDPNAVNLVNDDGSTYLQAHYREVASIIMERKVSLIEGLVVNMENGGIGFRNHSAPPVIPFGSEWSEDILFIEPESACVDTNLTLDFMLPKYSESGLASNVLNLALTDRGGFANHEKDMPKVDKSNTQKNPNLYERAHLGAWVNNAMTMFFMNVTNPNNLSDPNTKAYEYTDSTVGKRFSLTGNNSYSAPILLNPYTLQSSTLFGGHLPLQSNLSTDSGDPLYPNPFGIGMSNFSTSGDYCSGVWSFDKANITNFASQCGLLYGAPRQQNGDPSTLYAPGTNWSVPMYSCISATKAVLKTVHFRFNETDDLSGVSVTGLANKEYPDESSKPLWGVEHTNMTVFDVSALWGLVSSPNQGNVSIDTLRDESLYLPGYTGLGIVVSSATENLPGIHFHTNAMAAAYSIGEDLAVDYTGKSSLAMFRRWKDYSSDPGTANRILDLIWTDWAANTVVGSRGLHDDKGTVEKRAAPTVKDNNLYPVTVFSRRLRYHVPYGIPAFIVLFFTALISAGTLLSCFTGTGPGKMRRYLTRTSQARLLTARLYGSSFPQPSGGARKGPSSAETKSWRDTVGRKEISLSQQQPDQVVIHDSRFAERTEPLLSSGGINPMATPGKDIS